MFIRSTWFELDCEPNARKPIEIRHAGQVMRIPDPIQAAELWRILKVCAIRNGSNRSRDAIKKGRELAAREVAPWRKSLPKCY